MKTIMVHFSPNNHYLDKPQMIKDNDGFKREVDGFYVDWINGKTADVVFIRTWITIDGQKTFEGIMRKQKRVTLDSENNNSVYIKICGKQYRIGCYDDEE